MMIYRRTFMGGAALIAVAPLAEFLVQPVSLPADKISRIGFLIEGWTRPTADGNADHVSIRISSGWRTSWR